ncbi:hypothetical protein [Brunnivagina elsteri]|uniref:Uncharacterized protein n=1 Tax=Brunnivagina elsteri CCALA 953 TaxID=987040 RepID=A0A2A2TDL8_9CYAN|nr:hypothetical protein [Calothrix elsteri]PAX51736.1 hypothetical protein CK510_23185 [Calothrix elsteri CCALA 953]
MSLEQTVQYDSGYDKLPENATPLQKMQYEVGKEFMKGINNSQMNDVLMKYGLTAEKVIRFEVVVNLDQMREPNNAAIPESEMQSALKAIPAEELKLASCCWCWTRNRCVPCNSIC